MEWHIKCDPSEISRYIFCPGDQKRAKKIADQLDTSHLVTESRGYTVYSGEYKGIVMTVCGTGMGGPAVAIGVEELAHMGADTFIRVGSCGVFQEGQKPGDVIAASGTVRAGGTANAYLPTIFPAVPTFSVLRSLVEAGEELNIPVTVGVGIAGDSFYGPRDAEHVSSDESCQGCFCRDGKRYPVYCGRGAQLADRSHFRLRWSSGRDQAGMGRSRFPSWRDGCDQRRACMPCGTLPSQISPNNSL